MKKAGKIALILFVTIILSSIAFAQGSEWQYFKQWKKPSITGDAIFRKPMISSYTYSRIYNNSLSNAVVNSTNSTTPTSNSTAPQKNNSAGGGALPVDSNIKCEDSDEGKNYFVPGEVKNPLGGSSMDCCSTGDNTCNKMNFNSKGDWVGEGAYVLEKYCKDNKLQLESYKCDNGCKDGACLEKSPTQACKTGKYNCEKDSNGKETGYMQKCHDSSQGWVNAEKCANGCDSSTGQCIEKTAQNNTVVQNDYAKKIKCTESDAGFDTKKKGKLSLMTIDYNKKKLKGIIRYIQYNKTVAYTDSCSSNNLFEYACDDKDKKGYVKTLVKCENGCFDGACVENPQCVDSDGNNPDVAGKVVQKRMTASKKRSNPDRVYADKCLNSKKVTEYYCKNNISSASKTYSCEKGCRQGACIATNAKNDTTTTCTDSDRGLNYDVKGFTYGLSTDGSSWNKTDYCLGNIVYEYNCENNKPGGGGKFECPTGCIDGACLNISLSSFNQSNLNKLNVFFIADNYSNEDMQYFSRIVNRSIELGFSKIEPLAQNINRINFIKIERTGNILPRVNTTPTNIPVDTLLSMTKNYSNSSDSIFIIISKSKGVTTSFGAKSYVTIKADAPNADYYTVIHEIGHSYFDLRDEYDLTENFVALEKYDSYPWTAPNNDYIGCPKWCSGEINKMATVPYSNPKLNCYDQYVKFRDCLLSNNIDPAKVNGWGNNVTSCYKNVSGNGRIDLCDFGIKCTDFGYPMNVQRPAAIDLNKVGCYWSAKGLNVFRPSIGSVMNEPNNDFYFNPPSYKAVLEKVINATK